MTLLEEYQYQRYYTKTVPTKLLLSNIWPKPVQMATVMI